MRKIQENSNQMKSNRESKKTEKTRLHNDRYITYKKAQIEYLSAAESKGSSKQEIKNIACALKSWRLAFNLGESDFIGKELKIDFNESLKFYIQQQIKLNKKPGTYYSRVSIIKRFKDFYTYREEHKNLPQKFSDRLKFLIHATGSTIKSFFYQYLRDNLSRATLYSWCAGKNLPQHNKIPVIKLIEFVLGIPENTLVSRLPAQIIYSPTIVEIDFRVKLTEKCNKPYGLWNEQHQQELLDLCSYKLSIVPPLDMKRTEDGVWTKNSGDPLAEIPPSGKILMNHLKSFYGFLLLSPDNPDPLMRGLGIKKEIINIAQLTDKDLTEQYLTVFKKARADGKFNSGFITFINSVTCLLRKDTGYLYQKPEFSVKINLDLTIAQWQVRCLDTRQRLLEIKKFLIAAKKKGSSEYQVARNPQDPIRSILELKNPLSVTLKMTLRMLEDLEKFPAKYGQTRAILFRDCLLLTMMQANPLRAEMFRKMKLVKNLVKENDGSWWLQFNRHDFKNRRFLTEDYKVKLPRETWSLIERYLAEFRPFLLKKNKSDFVFVKLCGSKKLDPLETKISGIAFYSIIATRAKQYIDDSPGFGSHSYRHFVASSIVKNDPAGGIELAARALHDNRETIRQAYEHLKTNERFEPYNDFFGKTWSITNSEEEIRNYPPAQEVL